MHDDVLCQVPDQEPRCLPEANSIQKHHGARGLNVAFKFSFHNYLRILIIFQMRKFETYASQCLDQAVSTMVRRTLTIVHIYFVHSDDDTGHHSRKIGHRLGARILSCNVSNMIRVYGPIIPGYTVYVM